MSSLRLRGKLTALSIASGLIPLIIVILYLGITGVSALETQSRDFLKAKVEGFARMVEIKNSVIDANLEVTNDQLFQSHLIAEARNEKYYKTGYLTIFSSDGTCVYHPKAEYVGNKKLYDSNTSIREAVHKKKGFVEYKVSGQTNCGYLAYNEGLDWVMLASASKNEIFSTVKTMKTQMLVFVFVIFIIVGVAGVLVAGRITKVANGISDKMKEVAQGDADLSARLPVLSRDEVGDIAHWFNEFMGKLEEVILNVKLSAIRVNTSTQEVTAGSQGLSQATQEQASAIEEVAATIEEMTSAIKQNASNATEGKDKAQSMVGMANESGEASRELVRAMGEISDASRKIGDIIVTVNEVAFQTNLLALNAAVEAARAGEHGKGFAVVAEEVRALAQRSAEASRQIKVLIEDTVDKIHAGDEMVKNSRDSLEKILSQIQDLSLTMEEIAAASSEQASGVDELNRAVSQIDGTTQQNSATVEQLASTSDNLLTESRELAGTVARFKVSDSRQKTPPAMPREKTSPRNQSGTEVRCEQRTSPQAKPSYGDFEEF